MNELFHFWFSFIVFSYFSKENLKIISQLSLRYDYLQLSKALALYFVLFLLIRR